LLKKFTIILPITTTKCLQFFFLFFFLRFHSTPQALLNWVLAVHSSLTEESLMHYSKKSWRVVQKVPDLGKEVLSSANK